MAALLTCPNGHAIPERAEGDTAPPCCPECGADLAPACIDPPTLVPPTPAVYEARTLPITPPPADGDALQAPVCPALPGYEVLGELGRGGMGVVYKARQIKLGRVVALKMILAGSHAGPEDLARFQREAQAIARVQHPNIVQVYEVGEHQGLPYLALEYCPGGTLDHKLHGAPRPRDEGGLLDVLARAMRAAQQRGLIRTDLRASDVLKPEEGTPLPPAAAAELVETLAHAMQAAHAKGVLHRDLKPANVLLGEDGTPKISDFGLARKVDDARQTASGAVLGTPSYMAPEQASGRSREIGPVTDVWALGAVLYECLTGQPPFRGASSMDTILQVLGQEPQAARGLRPEVPSDLETICHKCLQKEPTKRYASAAALADDLHRFLAGEPIAARPVGPWGRAWRWCRRNPLVAAMALGVLVSLALATVVSALFAISANMTASEAEARAEAARREAWQAREAEWSAREALEKAQRQARAARHREYAAVMLLAQTAWDRKEPRRLSALLDSQRPAQGNEDLRGFEWHYWNNRAGHEPLVWRGHTGEARGIAFSADGRRLATAGADGLVKIWEVGTGKVAAVLDAKAGAINTVAFEAGGNRLAAGGADGVIRLWTLRAPPTVESLAGHKGEVFAISFSPEGHLASAGADGSVRIWAPRTSAPARLLSASARPVRAVVWGADGLKVVAGGDEGTLWGWETVTGALTLTVPARGGTIQSVAMRPDRRRIATATREAGLRAWDAMSGQEEPAMQEASRFSAAVAYSPDGKRLVAACPDGEIAIWELLTGQIVLRLTETGQRARAVSFRPDGNLLAVAYDNGEIRLYNGAREPSR